MNSNDPGLGQVVQTYRTFCRSGWPKGFGSLTPSLHSLLSCQWVSVLGPTYSFQLRPEYLFHVWHRTYPICDAPIRDRSVTEIAPKSLFLCVNRRRIRFGFRAAAVIMKCEHSLR